MDEPALPPMAYILPGTLLRVGEVAYWSTVRFAAGHNHAQTIHRLFSAALGHAGQGFAGPLSKGDTNIVEWGRLPGAFECVRVAWTIYGGDEADRRMLATRASWEWEFGAATLLPGTTLDSYTLPEQPPFTEDERAEVIRLLRERVPDVVLGLHSYHETIVAIPAGERFALRLNVSGFPNESNAAWCPTRDLFVRFVLLGTERVAVPVP